MEEIDEPLYKPGDFKKASESTPNYKPQVRKEIKIPFEDLQSRQSSKEKWELLEKIIKSKSDSSLVYS